MTLNEELYELLKEYKQFAKLGEVQKMKDAHKRLVWIVGELNE